MTTISPRLAKRQLQRIEASKFDPELLLDPKFPLQNDFIRDPAKLKCLFCTRRSGKSMTDAIYMIYEALRNPGVNCIFIGLTRLSARGIIWKDCLKVIDRKHKLRAKFNESMLTMTLPNGSVIQVVGANDGQEEMNKLLGRKYKVACIDESSMFTIDVEKLVYGILKPAMADVGGTICMTGTASNFTRGLFFEITTGRRQDWKVYKWGALDNPFIAKQWQNELDEIDQMRPLFKETPLFKQWYMNEWVIDSDKLVYKFREEKNTYVQLPKNLDPSGWTYILGVDTGWEDDNAFVLAAFHANDPTLYVVDTYNKPKMTFDQVISKIKEYLIDPERAPAKVIIDGANKQGVESMRQRSAIPFEYADKQDKPTFIQLLNGDLIQAKIKINRKCTALVDELLGLVWKLDSNDEIAIPRRENPTLSNHLCDAFLYAWRNGYHYMSTNIERPVVVGSREWLIKQGQISDDFWEQERERLMAQEAGEQQTDIYAGWPKLH